MFLIARQQAINSIAPAAPKLCPVIDLVELTDTFPAWGPKTIFMARVSILSFKLVEVPWALI